MHQAKVKEGAAYQPPPLAIGHHHNRHQGAHFIQSIKLLGRANKPLNRKDRHVDQEQTIGDPRSTRCAHQINPCFDGALMVAFDVIQLLLGGWGQQRSRRRRWRDGVQARQIRFGGALCQLIAHGHQVREFSACPVGLTGRSGR